LALGPLGVGQISRGRHISRGKNPIKNTLFSECNTSVSLFDKYNSACRHVIPKITKEKEQAESGECRAREVSRTRRKRREKGVSGETEGLQKMQRRKGKKRKAVGHSQSPWCLNMDSRSARSLAPVIDRIMLLPADLYSTWNSSAVQ
jgi:hypothetical protein